MVLLGIFGQMDFFARLFVFPGYFGNRQGKGRLYSMLSEIIKPGTMENIIIKAQHNCFSDRNTYSGQFIPIVHEYVMIVRKEDALFFPVLETGRKACDIRELPGATWRDVVAAVMEHAGKAVTLSFLYEQIGNHEKTRKNPWWKEKIRQTLQQYPEQFRNAGRGIWQLRRNTA